MKNTIKLFILSCFLFFVNSYAIAQDNVQPSVMVVPLKKQGESYRDLIESNHYIRSAITLINQKFLEKGFRTTDFLMNYQLLQEKRILESGNSTSIEQQVAENTNADIIIRVDAEMHQNGLGHFVEINLQAIDRQTGQNLSSIKCSSIEYDTNSFETLAKEALEDKKQSCLDNFLNIMDQQFKSIQEKGLPVSISITYSEDSDINGESLIDEINFITLSEIMSDYFKEQALNNYAHCRSNSSTNFVCNDFRIPLKDPKTDLPYDVSNVLSKFRKHFGKTYGIYCTGSINGTSLKITICGHQKCQN